MIGIGHTLNVVAEIQWRRTSTLVVASLKAMRSGDRSHAVRVSQHPCDVLIPTRSMYQSGGRVENRLVDGAVRLNHCV